MRKRRNLLIDDESYEAIRKLAALNKRKINAQIELMLLQKLKEIKDNAIIS